jgi:hypothetical protein
MALAAELVPQPRRQLTHRDQHVDSGLLGLTAGLPVEVGRAGT